MIDLSGRRVLVTGGGRGIGAACCRLFAAAGAWVAIGYRERSADAEALRADLPRSEEHLTLGADVGSEAGARGLIESVEKAWGGLDCLVNNAGVWWPTPLDDFDPARYRELLRINLDGSFFPAVAALPLLRASTDGNIVNVTSTAGQRGEARYGAYAASKGAMISATKAWSTELAPTVRVNSVAPGWVDTELCDEPFADGGREAIAAEIPLGRIATAEDIAGPILFLASPLARQITGEILNVNGGSVLVG